MSVGDETGAGEDSASEPGPDQICSLRIGRSSDDVVDSLQTLFS
jgi:hypothetical protein